MFVSAKNLQLHVQIYGEGTPLVILHGFAVDSEIMKGFLEPIFATRQGWQRIYIDTPGHGLSEYPSGLQTSDEMLDIVMDGIRNLLGDRPFVLAGLSYGGYLARGIVYRLGEQVEGLLLVCPAMTAYDRELPAHQVLVNTTTQPVSDGFRQIAVVQTDEVWARFQKEIVPGVERFVPTMRESEFVKQNFAFSFEENLFVTRYHKPVLIINGRQDSAVGYRDVWRMIESCPRASYAILDQAGHLVEIEQAGVVTALVEEWLDRVEINR